MGFFNGFEHPWQKSAQVGQSVLFEKNQFSVNFGKYIKWQKSARVNSLEVCLVHLGNRQMGSPELLYKLQSDGLLPAFYA